MIKIKDFSDRELRITWTLLYLGFRGESKYKGLLKPQDIINYAIQKIDDEESYEVVLLAGLSVKDSEDIHRLLEHLSKNENVNVNIELRKWRVIFVLKNIPQHTNYLQGLLDLGDIWAFLDFPDDSPHVFQGRNNNITPEKYYCMDMYQSLILDHMKWIKKEIADIESLESFNCDAQFSE